MDDVEVVAEAADNDVVVGCILGDQRICKDANFVVRHDKAELFDQVWVANVSKFRGLRAGFSEAGFDTEGVGGVEFVGSGEAVKFGCSGGLNGKVAHGEGSGGRDCWVVHRYDTDLETWEYVKAYREIRRIVRNKY